MKAAALFIAMILGVVAGASAQSWPADRIKSAYADSVVFIDVAVTSTNGTPDQWHGTGFVINDAGFVLTNSHVVPRPSDYKTVVVRGSVRSRYLPSVPLHIVHRDDTLDIALLRLHDVGVKRHPIRRGNSNAVSDGSRLMVLGFPLGEDLLPTEGLLGNKNAQGGRWITSAPLNPGNSGGPAFDQEGNVVAMVVGGNSKAQLLNYLIPINFAAAMIDMAEGGQKTPPPFLIPSARGTERATDTPAAVGDCRPYQEQRVISGRIEYVTKQICWDGRRWVVR